MSWNSLRRIAAAKPELLDNTCQLSSYDAVSLTTGINIETYEAMAEVNTDLMKRTYESRRWRTARRSHEQVLEDGMRQLGWDTDELFFDFEPAARGRITLGRIIGGLLGRGWRVRVLQHHEGGELHSIGVTGLEDRGLYVYDPNDVHDLEEPAYVPYGAVVELGKRAAQQTDSGAYVEAIPPEGASWAKATQALEQDPI